MDTDEKESSIESFTNATSRVIITTSGLSAGVNFLDVELVIHAGTPLTLIDFAQESGRAGRQGQLSYSHVIPNQVRRTSTPDTLGIAGLNHWIENTSKCRCLGLSRYLDGSPVSCDMLASAHLCDVCLGNIPASSIQVSTMASTTPTRALMSAVPLSMSSLMKEQKAAYNQTSSIGQLHVSGDGSRLSVDTSANRKRRFASSAQALSSSRLVQPPLPFHAPTRPAAALSSTPARTFTAVLSPTQRTPGYLSDSVAASRSRSERELVVERIRQRLQRVWGGCHFCLGHGMIDKKHPTARCPQARINHDGWLLAKKRWKSSCQWKQPGVLCYKCWLPQLDSFFHPNGGCKYEDTLPEMLYALFIGKEKAQVEGWAGRTFPTEGSWKEWLTQEAVTIDTPNVWKAAEWMLEGVLKGGAGMR